MRKLAFLLLGPPLLAQTAPDARDLLTRADASIFTAKTVRLAAIQARGYAGQTPLPGSRLKIEFVRGGRGRTEFSAGLSNVLISLTVFDGSYLWEYHELGKQYTKKPATAWIFQGEIATLEYGRNRNNISSASYENDESIDFAGHPVACAVIRADYRAAPRNRFGKDIVRRVWISKDKEQILRDYWEGALSGVGNARETVTTNYTAIETDVPLSDDLFVFQPPAGSKLGEPVMVGGVAGGIPSAPFAPPPPPPPPVRAEEKLPPGAITVGANVQRANLIKRTIPVYPPLAKESRIQGVVRLKATISKEGAVENLSLISGHPLLSPAALEAVKNWVYKPTLMNGEPVAVFTEIDVTFSLSDSK